jgi:hypothetical protein
LKGLFFAHKTSCAYIVILNPRMHINVYSSRLLSAQLSVLQEFETHAPHALTGRGGDHKVIVAKEMPFRSIAAARVLLAAA